MHVWLDTHLHGGSQCFDALLSGSSGFQGIGDMRQERQHLLRHNAMMRFSVEQ